MRKSVRFAVFAMSLAVATPVFAQNVSLTMFPSSDSSVVVPDTTVQAPASVSMGAPLTGLRAGVHARETSRPNQPTMAAASQHLGQDRAMMIVGAAALVTGAIIGGAPGTIVMVGGAVVGLMGLYNYLQ